jgi:hypothetical protein
MNQIARTVDRYISIWNEPNPERRRELIATTWTEDGSYRDPLLSGDGHAGFESVVAQVATLFPGHTLKLTTGVDVVGDTLRFGWSAVNDATGEPAVAGVDFATVAQDGRLRSITGFHDLAPVLAEGS